MAYHYISSLHSWFYPEDLGKSPKKKCFQERRVCVCVCVCACVRACVHVYDGVCVCVCVRETSTLRVKENWHNWVKLLSKAEMNNPSRAPQGHSRASSNRSWNKYKHRMASCLTISDIPKELETKAMNQLISWISPFWLLYAGSFFYTIHGGWWVLYLGGFSSTSFLRKRKQVKKKESVCVVWCSVCETETETNTTNEKMKKNITEWCCPK